MGFTHPKAQGEHHHENEHIGRSQGEGG